MNDAHTTPPDESRLTGMADVLVHRLIKADRNRRIQVGVLTIVCVVLSGLLAFSLWNGAQVRTLASQNQQIVKQVKHGSIANCEAGNRARHANETIWDAFLTLLISNPEGPKTRAALTRDIAAIGLPADIEHGLLLVVDATTATAPDAVRIVRSFEMYIGQHEAPVNCPAVYAKASSLGG